MTTGTPTGHSPANVPENRKLYWALWGCGWAIIAAALLVALMAWDVELINEFGIAFSGGPTAILFIALYTILSYREVPANSISGSFCYGKALVRLVSGPHFIPFGIMQIGKEPRTVQEFQCPGEPEKVFKGDDKEKLPEGMVRSIRAVTRAPRADEKDLLDTRMTLGVNFVVQYAITDIFDFVANFGTKEEAEKQLRDIGEVTIVEKITKNTPSSFINNLGRINEHLGEKIKERFQNSGVKIISVRLISPDISHEVSRALAGIPVARARAQRAGIIAEAVKVVRTKKGEGDGAADQARLEAKAVGTKKIKEALGITDGNAVLASEAVRGILEKTDVLVMGGEGMRDAMGLVKAAQSALNSGKGATP